LWPFTVTYETGLVVPGAPMSSSPSTVTLAPAAGSIVTGVVPGFPFAAESSIVWPA
jgi:hypothetical protein